MFRRVVASTLIVVVLIVSGFWIQARLAERCPDVGVATAIDATVTARDAWRFADLAVSGRQYTVEPSVAADFGAYAQPIPLPQSHHVGVNIAIHGSDASAVSAWTTTCLRLTHGDEAVSRPASAGRDLLTGGGTGSASTYRVDGVFGYPEWPPGDNVDVEVTFLVDGHPFLLRLAGVPIVGAG